MNKRKEYLQMLVSKSLGFIQVVFSFYRECQLNLNNSIPMRDYEWLEECITSIDKDEAVDVSLILKKLMHYKNFYKLILAKKDEDISNELKDVQQYFCDIPSQYLQKSDFCSNHLESLVQANVPWLDSLLKMFEKLNVSDHLKLKDRYEELKNVQPNEFEQAIIDMDTNSLMKYYNNDSFFNSLDYSAIEIMGIKYALSTFNPIDMGYMEDVGKRLYYIQGNEHNLAEKYLLESLFKKDISACKDLMTLYKYEKDWERVINVYRCFAEEELDDISVRVMYMEALIKRKDRALQEHIVNNFVDFITYLSQERDAVGEVAKLIDSSCIKKGVLSYKFAEQLKSILDVHEIPFYRSVITYDDNLRERVSDDRYLSRLGFSKDEISHIQHTFDTNDYNREINLIGTIDRVFKFIDFNAGLALRLTRLLSSSNINIADKDNISAKVAFLLGIVSEEKLHMKSAYKLPHLEFKMEASLLANFIEEIARDMSLGFIVNFIKENSDAIYNWYTEDERKAIITGNNTLPEDIITCPIGRVSYSCTTKRGTQIISSTHNTQIFGSKYDMYNNLDNENKDDSNKISENEDEWVEIAIPHNENINNIGVNDLVKNYNSFEDLFNSFNKNRNSYESMLKNAKSSETEELLHCVYRIVEKYGTLLSEDGIPINEREFRAFITDSIDELEDLDYEWEGVNNHIRGLLKAERNRVNAKPKLEIQVLSDSIQTKAHGSFYGMVKNTSNRLAQDVQLQILFRDESGDEKSSAIFNINKINGHDIGYFKVPYDDFEIGSVKYRIEVDFDFNGTREYCKTVKGRFDFVESIQLNTPIGEPYPLLHQDFTYNAEKEEVTNEYFFGCNEQKLKLQSLVSGNKFADYCSAMIYGERRSGKTLLLNYFEAYVKGKLPDVICINITAQSGMQGSVQETFIQKVLDEFDTKKIFSENSPQWDEWVKFKEEWKLSDDEKYNRAPRELRNFFIRLYNLSGKGLIFLLDEFDAFLHSYSNSNRKNKFTLDDLYDALTELIENTESRRAVHFVFCGSNRILLFTKTGKKLQQFMQKLGDKIIETFYLSREEFNEMLHYVGNDYKNITYTKEALDILWRFTKGSAWYGKHLGNAAVNVALKSNREVVYPSDIFDGMDKVMCANACEHLQQGLENDDKTILYAIRYCANEIDKYVSIADIKNVLSPELVDYLDSALTRLDSFKILERNPRMINQYRFKTELHREYFGRQMPYEMNRPVENDLKFKEIIDNNESESGESCFRHGNIFDLESGVL